VFLSIPGLDAFIDDFAVLVVSEVEREQVCLENMPANLYTSMCDPELNALLGGYNNNNNNNSGASPASSSGGGTANSSSGGAGGGGGGGGGGGAGGASGQGAAGPDSGVSKAAAPRSNHIGGGHPGPGTPAPGPLTATAPASSFMQDGEYLLFSNSIRCVCSTLGKPKKSFGHLQGGTQHPLIGAPPPLKPLICTKDKNFRLIIANSIFILTN